MLNNFNVEEMLSEQTVISASDIDFYKKPMGQFILKNFPQVWVRFSFILRTKNVRLAEVIPEKVLREELDRLMALTFARSQIYYLRGADVYGERMFGEDYLKHLENLHLPPYHLEIVDGNYKIYVEGLWSIVTYWETMILSAINELYYRELLKRMSRSERDEVIAHGVLNLREKVRFFKDHPEIPFSDFGTRRRLARLWHEYCVVTVMVELPRSQFVGTSNTHLAHKYDLPPTGTNAHEQPMGIAALADSDEELARTYDKFLDLWWSMYGEGLSIVLPDTFGSASVLRGMTREQAQTWKGFRHDSGDPIAFGEAVIKFYQQHEVDPRGKLIIFSDGLDIHEMLRLYNHFFGRIKVTFGWGTNLTNDLGLKPLSMVVKASAVRWEWETNWRPTVKLSDNPAKAMGPAAEIERYKHVFKYQGGLYVPCTY